MIRLSSRAVRAAALLILMTAARAAHAQATPMQGDGTPQPIVWFRADSLRALAANAPVTHWPDSTNATGSEAVAQTGADAGQPPTYSLTGVGGKPAVHFAASRRTRLTFPRPVQDDFTIVCVFASAQGLGNGYSWREGAGLVGDMAQAWDAQGQDDFGLALSAGGQVLGGTGDWDRDLASGQGANDGKPHLAVFLRVKRKGVLSLYVDGTLADSSSDANKQKLSQIQDMTLGAMGRHSGMTTYLTGDIAEVRFYDTALADADRQAIEGALKAQYGIVPVVSQETVSTVPASARLQPVILPPAPEPVIHGPQIVGATPGHSFLFRIPTTGDGPLTFSCPDLPPGLALDPKTGIISGTAPAAGRDTLHLSVANPQGKSTRVLTLVTGDHPLALTPPMGWDAVNLYANTVDDAKMRAAADALIKSGLAAHGWATVHVNDTWQGIRDKATGEILPNRRRFPNMKALGESIHAQGLKFGLESAATEHTCAGYPGSLGHAAQDAATYADWGVDYLQYDWCPVAALDEKTPPDDQPAAFKEMRSALNKTGRDIVLAADTFGDRDPGDWAPGAGVNTWVTSRQVFDDWAIVTRAVFDQPWAAERAGPGHWGNPGLLMVGKSGVGAVRPSRLSPAQQMSQMTQSVLLSAPLWISCDLTALDPNAFHPSVTAMLTNDEVLDVDQDPAGYPAAQISGNRAMQVWSKPLADGTIAVGLFNLSDAPRRMRITSSQIKLTGAQPVRDLWLHQNLGEFAGTFATDLPAYGVALLKIGRPAAPK